MLEVSVAVCELQMFDWLVEITGAGVLFMVMVFAVVVARVQPLASVMVTL